MIFVENPNDWGRHVEVPPAIVRYCENYTMLDRHHDSENLRLIDCYWYNMGYYGDGPRPHMQEYNYDVIPIWD